MEQSFLNWIFTAFGAAIGWILKVIWDAISDLKQDMKELSKLVENMEALYNPKTVSGI